MTENMQNPDRLRAILATVTNVAVEIEQVIAATGVAGNFDAAQVEKLTLLFGNLAAAAIQAAHDALGREITPESVLELMPVATELEGPA
ncbi:MAG: hypothetical protein ACRD4F_17755 [Candidatus Angelobacter sp.]